MDAKQMYFYSLVILASYLHTVYAPGQPVKLTLSQIPKDVQTGQNVGLECKVTDKEVDWTEWRLPDGTIASHNCSLIAENKTYLGLTCGTQGQDELFQLDISQVDHVRDDGVYTCIHNETTADITLDVQVPVTEVNKSEDVTVPIDGTQDIMCVTICAHPDPIIAWTENTIPVTLVPVEQIENCDGTKLNRTRSVLTVPWNETSPALFECCAGLANNALDTCQQITVSFEEIPTTTEEVTTPEATTGSTTTVEPTHSTTTVETTPQSTSTVTCVTRSTTTVETTESTTTVEPTQQSTITVEATPQSTTTVGTTQSPSTTTEESSATRVAGHLLVNLLVISCYIAFN